MASNLAEFSDSTIVTRINAGDEQAFAELFRRYYEPVIRFTYRYVHSMDAARDVTQELFIRCWGKRKDLPVDGISAYLFRAARNAALNLLKHDEVVARWEAKIKLEASHQDDDQINADDESLSARVLQALDSLSPRAREIVMLSRVEGMKPREIAGLLGISAETVYVHLSRALKQLEAVLR